MLGVWLSIALAGVDVATLEHVTQGDERAYVALCHDDAVADLPGLQREAPPTWVLDISGCADPESHLDQLGLTCGVTVWSDEGRTTYRRLGTCVEPEPEPVPQPLPAARAPRKPRDVHGPGVVGLEVVSAFGGGVAGAALGFAFVEYSGVFHGEGLAIGSAVLGAAGFVAGTAAPALVIHPGERGTWVVGAVGAGLGVVPGGFIAGLSGGHPLGLVVGGALPALTCVGMQHRHLRSRARLTSSGFVVDVAF